MRISTLETPFSNFLKLIFISFPLVLPFMSWAQDPDTVNLPKTDPEQNPPQVIYYQTADDTDYEKRINAKYKRSNEIKTISGNMNHSGGFFGISFRSSEFNDETMVMAGIRTGWIINRTLGIGFEGFGIIPTAKYANIDPILDVITVGGYGGMYLELIIFSNQVIHATFPFSGGAGYMNYTQDWEKSNTSGVNSKASLVDEDVFWYFEPGANLEMNVSRNVRLNFGASKRFTQDLILLNTPTDAFDNLTYYVTLKIGGF